MDTKKALWLNPWGYREGLLITLGIALVSMLLGLISNQPFKLPPFPGNIQIGLGFLVLIIGLHVFFQNKLIVKNLSSIPLSISAITFYAILSLIMGLVPQNTGDAIQLIDKIGISHIKDSWLFAFSNIFLLTNLLLVILRRLPRKGIKNLAFMINHLGLFIIIFAAAIGSSDLMRMKFTVNYQQTTSIASDEIGNEWEMPFSIQLKKFEIDHYPAKLAWVDRNTGEIATKTKGNLSYALPEKNVIIKPYTIYTDSVLIRNSDTTSTIPYPYSIPEVFVRVSDGNNKIISGSIMPATHFKQPSCLMIDEKNALCLLLPESKKYTAHINVFISGKNEEKRLEVNQAAKIADWKLYLLSYNEKQRENSDYVIIEAIRDPWLPVIITGIIMLLIGSAYLIITGKQKIKKE